MMKSALLFYRKLIAELRDMGFTINPYDPCIANKMVNGSQMTIRWHVNDLMISHAIHDDIMTFVQQIKDIYGERQPPVNPRPFVKQHPHPASIMGTMKSNKRLRKPD